MSKQTADTAKSSTTRTSPTDHAFITQALAPLQELNRRCIELMKNAASGRKEQGQFELASQLDELLTRMPAEAIQRAASRRVLLVEFQFRKDAWWRSVRSGSRKARVLRSAPCFPRKSGVALARATLTLAWTLVRTDVDTAGVILGMSQKVAEIIATLELSDIDRISERHFDHLRPRWETRPLIWRKLLVAAQANDANELRLFDLHVLQLLAGELFPSENQA